MQSQPPAPPFADFAASLPQQSATRRSITAAYRMPEPQAVAGLLARVEIPLPVRHRAHRLAAQLVEALREKQTGSGVEGLIREYSLSSQEGVALMCLAEALLRIPDDETRDALIRDKIGGGDWEAHLGQNRSLFVNAATWGLLITGKLTATNSASGLGGALTRLLAKSGEPLIRNAVRLVMRMMGEQFVAGQSIEEALERARPLEARGYRHSYDMLGEAALTDADAARYMRSYESAIHAIGKAAGGRGVIRGPGISIKLSALHPRFHRSQRSRVMGELLPRLSELALLACRYDIGLNIDAEEADRLDLSLDLLEALCRQDDLRRWEGLGFVVQAYQKRAIHVIDHLIELAQASRRRLMVRLVKGAYWDSEIKRSQVDGLADFPVFTRKAHTDISYLACARRLLQAGDTVFPQFATHNALSLATIHELAGPTYNERQYEFQCLHGMGEPLYDEVVGRNKLARPCRIYAPVGSHETLLPYLVRRLLENGANTSFVNQLADRGIAMAELLADPLGIVAAGQPHDKIAHPELLFTERRNSRGCDLSNESVLRDLANRLGGNSLAACARPTSPGQAADAKPRTIHNPATPTDVVGSVIEAGEQDIEQALTIASTQAEMWQQVPVARRAEFLFAAADRLERDAPAFYGLIVREAGRTLANAVSEVREAVDFLRYYAAEAVRTLSGAGSSPLGPVICISPWNFPLAIFTGQIAASLVAGNTVIAKPAEETPLVGARMVALLHEAGVPRSALHLVPGDGRVGGALVADPRCHGVVFTGSTTAARSIQRALSLRLNPDGRPVPFIAETGGQNAMIVDSSALPEQVVGDVMQSAFDSAGQRCSALRLLCLQEEIADRTLEMLKGGMRELALQRPDRLDCDIGPVISGEAAAGIEKHIATMKAAGRQVFRAAAPSEDVTENFVIPTYIEIASVAELKEEIFGPVLHVLRYRREDLQSLLVDINKTGFGLTFGVHTRIDEVVEAALAASMAGNAYINRNMIGAVVGVQPFGGHGLSGTGPKAGGPLYLRRLMRNPPPLAVTLAQPINPTELSDPLLRFILERSQSPAADAARRYARETPLGFERELAGPVGEQNLYRLASRGRLLLIAASAEGLFRQIAAAIATGNEFLILDRPALREAMALVPSFLAARFERIRTLEEAPPFAGVLHEGGRDDLLHTLKQLADRPGPVVPVVSATPAGLDAGSEDYPLEWLLGERSISINTAAAGGNASLMTIG